MKSSKFSYILLFSVLIALVLHSFAHSAIAQPTSTNYELSQYGFGSGGDSLTGTNYNLFGTLGEVDVGSPASSLYNIGDGLVFTMQANVPPAPTFANQNDNYNRLHVTLNTGNNPSDAIFAIMISNDAFVSDINYIQSDQTVGTTLGSEDWQTYTTWGGATGFDVIGLDTGTTYTIRVSVRHGDFTQSRWGPSASASTSQPSISFDIDISSADTETAPPYTVAFGTVSPQSVNTATEKVWIDLDTNADSGGYVYIYSENAGLLSSNLGYTITSATGDLSVASEGFGIRSDTASETSGGPLTALTPYDGASDNVGVVDTTVREVYSSSTAPIIGGRGSFQLKVKPSATTPASNDYTDTLTVIAAATF